MEFEWDEDKNRQNVAKHGVSFELAQQIFDGFTVDRIDDRFAYEEMRELSLGVAGSVTILAVVHTDRDGTCRMISARQADGKEKKHYEKEIRKTFDV